MLSRHNAPAENGIIRVSTREDIQEIYRWLVDQDDRKLKGSFLCNWDTIAKSHSEGKILVYVGGKDKTAIAYQWGSLIRPGILEVRNNMRGMGIGRKMVEHLIAQAVANNECFLYIHCTPSSSISFWKRMGFTLLKAKNGDQHAYRILKMKKHELPAHAEAINVKIHFYPEFRLASDDMPADIVAKPCAVIDLDGVIHLAERVGLCKHLYPREVVVKIEIAGQLRYCERAKYPESGQIGIKTCTGGFYVDQLKLGEVVLNFKL
jgi:GNAT superfamily N-acetyltransferase